MRWVAAYERAWRDEDVAAVPALFSDDAAYRVSPYAQSKVGQDAIAAFWTVDEGRAFSMDATPVAVDGQRAVVRVDVQYGDPPTQEYRDLWLLHFAADGRVQDFEEWAYWPEKGHLAEDS